jgi:alkylation response protein AidB-like acyl-CoA dehydrogenase
MSAGGVTDPLGAERRSAVDAARELGPIFDRTSETSDEDNFVDENFALLKSTGLVAAGVPAELGGGGADIGELATMLRTLGRHCGSTALAFSMHTHLVAVAAWRWKHQKVETVGALLERIARERILLVTSGGSDWIAGSGRAERVQGGYRIVGRKAFASGVPAGDLFMTSAILENEGEPPMVLHFGIPLNSPNVRVLDTWRTLGMRGSGSHDLLIEDHFVADAAIAARRKAGEWDPLFEVIATISMPLIYAVYLGVAESARDIAILLAQQKKATHYVLELAGRLDMELTAARLAWESMVEVTRLNAPSAHTVNQVMTGKQLVTRHGIGAVELAMQLAGGLGFYRSAGLERRFRDIQAARYHPLQSGPQAQFAGAMALGLPVDRIF